MVNNSRKQIKFGAIISYAALLLNISLTLIYTPWMVGKIGKANYGLYTLAISLIGVFLVDFGISSAISRFMSKYRAEGNNEKVNQFISCAFKLYFLIDILLAVAFTVIFLLLGNIYKSLSPEELSVFKVIFVIVAGFNLIAFPMTPLSGILSAYEEYIWLKLCDFTHKLLIVILVVVALWFNTGVVAVVLANVIGGIITIVLKLIVVKKKVPIRIIFGRTDKAIYKSLLSFSVWTTLIVIAIRLTQNLAPSILAITTGSIAVAYFSPAVAINGYYYSIANAINGLFMPMLSRYIANKNEEKILPLMVKVGRYQIAMLGLIYAGFFCIGKDFMTLWMGKDFVISYYCALLFMFPSIFEYSQQIGNTTIIVKNLVKYQAILAIATSVVGCGIAFFTSAKWGAIGSSIAICLVGMLNVIGMNVIHYKNAGLNIFSFYKQSGTMLLPVIMTCVVGSWVISFFDVCSVPWLLLKAIIVGGIYLLFVLTIGVQKQERDIIAAYCKKAFSKIKKR